MKNGNPVDAVFESTAVSDGVGISVTATDSTIDFGEIIIDGIPDKSAEDVRIMSFNVRYCDDKAGSVKNRSKISLAIVNQYEPDSFGVQEATGEWIDIFTEGLGEKYTYAGEARDEKGYKSEYNSVFYLKDKYNLIANGTIWLSETPEVKYSKSFDSNCHRIASWAVLENKETGEKYTHLNTHLDHVLEKTRTAQIDVFIDKLTELKQNGSVFCTGDFNTEPDSETYAKMLVVTDDARLVAKNSDKGITFHNYGTVEEFSAGPIDYIFVPKGAKVDKFKIIRNTAKGMYPSDHYPIVADITTEV